MKRNLLQLVVVCVAVLVSGSAYAAGGTLTISPGDDVYVCACGKCDCGTVAKKAAKCNCGHELTKVTVDKVKGQKVSYTVGGKTRKITLKGKYACGCEGAACCGMISQKPGKCACNKDMVAAQKK